MFDDRDDSTFRKKKLTPSQAKVKAMKFCAYQERSQHELRQKLFEWGLYSTDVEEIIGDMIEQNFLNEERFAKAYAGGKFRMKHWGKVKIEQGLKQHRISTYCIRQGLAEIEPDVYIQALRKILKKKWDQQTDLNDFERRQACGRYALQKGYEWEVIEPLVKDLGK